MSPADQFSWVHPWPASFEFAGEMLAARLAELAARPHPEKCDRLLQDLEDAAALVARGREVLLQRSDPPEA